MKIRNKTIYSEDREYLQMLADELDFIGRAYRLDLAEGTLTQLALQPRKAKRTKKKSRGETRNKRSESAARRA